MTRFDTDTAVTPTGEPGRFDCRIDEAWWIVAGPNGGYVAAIATRAVEATYAEAGDRRLRSITVHFARAPKAGPAAVQVDTVREGGSVTFAQLRMLQGGEVFATGLAVLARARETLTLHTPIDLPTPPPEEVLRPPLDGGYPPIVHNYDIVTKRRETTGPALTDGWLRLREERELDAPLLAAYVDAWLPPLFVVTEQPIAIPTLDLTIHFRAPLPRPYDWVYGEFLTREAGDGFADEDARIAAPDGTLLAQGRQLSLIR